MTTGLSRGEFLAPDCSLLVPPQYAHLLEKRAGITDEQRRRYMTSDPTGYRFLVALHLSAESWRSRRGTERVVSQSDIPFLDEWLTSTQAAELLGVTRRCITKRCASGRLKARRLGRSWMVHHSEIRARRAELD